jgi:hypothetical protein
MLYTRALADWASPVDLLLVFKRKFFFSVQENDAVSSAILGN